MSGFLVDLGAMQVVADGIQGVLDELGQLGINGQQESGSPIENVALSSDDMGSAALASLTADALQRAHYALRTALRNGAQTVTVLQRVHAAYQQTEAHVGGLFGQISQDMATATHARSGHASVSRGTPGWFGSRLAGGHR